MGRPHKSIAFLALFFVAGLPVSRTLCAVHCLSAPHAASSHRAHAHGGGDSAGHAAAGPGQLHVRSAPAHDCRSHQMMAGDTAILASASHPDTSMEALGQALVSPTPNPRYAPSAGDRLGLGPPLETHSPTRTSVVLRI